MKSFGKCEKCGSKIVARNYKLRTGLKDFKQYFSCEKTTAHSLTQDEIMEIDVDYHRNFKVK